MKVKLHLSGVAIAYEPRGGTTKDRSPLLTPLPSRPNGSLYNRQKRRIADATEWLRLHQRPDRKAMIFCLTSPGYIDTANSPRFISRFVDNMKANYGMENYVWVRELTKLGYPHFHFIAHWNNPKWFFEDNRLARITKYWSGQFKSDSTNSVRFGSYHPKTKKRQWFVTHPKQCHYLSKYIGKNLGEEFFQMDGEANCIIQPAYKNKTRSFGMSEDLGMLSEPQLFDYQTYENGNTRKVMLADGSYFDFNERSDCYIGESGQLDKSQLLAYNWKWTGHGQTFIGYKKHSHKRTA